MNVLFAQIIVFSLWVIARCEDNLNKCNRQKSRIVRNVINKKLVKAFDELDVELPIKCPLHSSRDIYTDQEDHKLMESLSRWTCLYCGKSFVAEDFLDRHFTNRHSEKIQINKNTICLADYCDVFRCDIISGFRKPDFWDMALCMEDDMEEAAKECQNLMKTCLPTHATNNQTKYIKNLMQDAVCSYLTCKKFWDIAQTDTPGAKTAIFVVMSILIAFGLVIYYCVFYQFYFTDTFSGDTLVYDPTPQGRHRIIPYGDVRQRARSGSS